MAGPDRPRLVQDATGRAKLQVSLPGGRYQLSLDDSGAVLLRDGLGYDTRDVVPDLVARVLVATGDAWFPHQRDYESVAAELPETTAAGTADLAGIADYLRSRKVPEKRVELVRDIVRSTPLADHLDPGDVQVKELPPLPEGIFETDEDSATNRPAVGESAAEPSPEADAEPTAETLADQVAARTGADRAAVREAAERLLDSRGASEAVGEALERRFDDDPSPDVFDVPGVGLIRGARLVGSGVDSVADLAETTPADLSARTPFDETWATTIVEGARELVGETEPTAARLAQQTGVPRGTFEGALSQLAAAGVPPSAAAGPLREQYGPSLTDVDGVDGRMAYFLHEAGYPTPWDLVQASPVELEAVSYVGETTAERIRAAATDLIGA